MFQGLLIVTVHYFTPKIRPWLYPTVPIYCYLLPIFGTFIGVIVPCFILRRVLKNGHQPIVRSGIATASTAGTN